MGRRRRRTGRFSSWVATAIGGLLVVGLVLYLGISSIGDLLGGPTGPSGSNSVGAVGSASEAGEALAKLPVEAPGPMSGYSRDDFPHWSDGADNGWDVPSESCDTREAALIRDGQNVVVGESCSIDSGTWVDPYAGETNTDPSDVDIDHVVPLANAWRSGADNWDEAERERFANAPNNLLASDAGENRSKGDRGPETWRPPDESAWCDYAIRWTQVKEEYQLSVNPDEKASLQEMLETCEAA